MYMLNRAKELAYNTIEMPNFLEAKKDTFNNGLNLFYIDGGDLDICHLELIFEAGTKVQSKPLQAALCNAMLLEGTLKSSADEIHNQIDAYGAYTNLDINADRAIVSLYTLNKYFKMVVPIFINAIATAAPSNSKTIETVVEVGMPTELKKSSNKISVIITAIKIIIISLNINSPGLKIPFLATSIIPLENTAPTAIPILATIIIVLNEIALEPIAEFKKLTASLLTPTTKSAIAKTAKATIINK